MRKVGDLCQHAAVLEHQAADEGVWGLAAQGGSPIHNLKLLCGDVLDVKGVVVIEQFGIESGLPGVRLVLSFAPLGLEDAGTLDNDLSAGGRFVADHLVRTGAATRGLNEFAINAGRNDNAFTGLPGLGGFVNGGKRLVLVPRITSEAAGLEPAT